MGERRASSDNMIWFSDRKRIADEYKEWAKENNVLDCPESVIAYLQIKGLVYEGIYCRECIHYEEDPCDTLIGTCRLTKRETNADGYCDKAIKAQTP